MTEKPDVGQLPAIAADMRDKLERAQAELPAIDAERAKHAFAAATGSEPAKRALDKLNRRKVEIIVEIETLEAALVEANRRGEAAQRDAQLAEQSVNAERALQIGAGLLDRARKLDEALAVVVAESKAIEADIRELNHRLGCKNPHEYQFASLGTRAFKAALMFSPLKLEHLAPNQRRTFTELAVGWSETIATWASRYLPKKDEAA
jgi:hypothetical protein